MSNESAPPAWATFLLNVEFVIVVVVLSIEIAPPPFVVLLPSTVFASNVEFDTVTSPRLFMFTAPPPLVVAVLPKK